MTVMLELKPEVEAAAQAEAQAQGLPVESYLQSFLERTLPQISQPENTESIRLQRIAVLERLQGKYAGLGGGSEEFAAKKAEEKEREERLWVRAE